MEETPVPEAVRHTVWSNRLSFAPKARMELLIITCFDWSACFARKGDTRGLGATCPSFGATNGFVGSRDQDVDASDRSTDMPAFAGGTDVSQERR